MVNIFMMTELKNTRQWQSLAVLINWQHKLLMTLIWLGSYPAHQHLSFILMRVTPQNHDTVNKIWLILRQLFKGLNACHTLQEWAMLIDNQCELVEAVGCIAVTPHKTNLSRQKPNSLYWSQLHALSSCIGLQNKKLQ